MKRLSTYTFIATAIATTLLFVSCGSTTGKKEAADSKAQFIVSIAPLRPLVSEIVGDDFDISILVPAGASPESFEPTPRQFKAVNEAEAIFAVGLIDFERNLLSKVEHQEKIINLSHGIELIAGSCSHHHHCEDSHHPHHHAHGIDPHIWVSPVALKTMAQNAYNAVAAAYPDSVKYKANYERLAARLNALDNSGRAICADARTHRFIINHPALTYLARDYGLEQISIEHEGKEPSAKRLTNLIDNARNENTRRVFYQSTYPRSTVEVIAEDIGAEPVEINPLREDIFVNIPEITHLITE